MTLQEKTFVDMIAWRPEYATIEVRVSNIISKDGVEITRTFERHVVPPEQDDLSGEDPQVQDIAALYGDERDAKAAYNEKNSSLQVPYRSVKQEPPDRVE